MPPAATVGFSQSNRELFSDAKDDADLEAEYRDLVAQASLRDSTVRRETMTQFKRRRMRAKFLKFAENGLISTVLVLGLWMPAFAYAFHRVEGWGAWDAYIFVSTVCSTIGYGNIVPEKPAGKWLVIVCALFGIPLVLHALSFIGVVARSASNVTLHHLKACAGFSRATTREDEIVFCALLIVVYFLHCVVIYERMEGWSLTTAAYYSFSTFSTVGLGDYVPLSDRRDRNVERLTWYHVWHVAAVVAGMALVSLLFTLLHERAMIAEKHFRESRDRADLRKLRQGLSLRRQDGDGGDADPVLVATRRLLAAAYCQCGEDWHEFFDAFDTNHDGHIEQAELVAAFRTTLRAEHVSDARIAEIFRKCDRDGSGFIDPEELIALMDMSQVAFLKMGATQAPKREAQEAKREDVDVETEVARTIDAATRDADGEASRPVPFADASFSRARDSLTITRPAARPEPTKNSWFSSKKTAPASRF